MRFLWDSYGIPMRFLWDSYAIPIRFLWDSYEIPMRFLGFLLAAGTHFLESPKTTASEKVSRHSGLHSISHPFSVSIWFSKSQRCGHDRDGQPHSASTLHVIVLNRPHRWPAVPSRQVIRYKTVSTRTYTPVSLRIVLKSLIAPLHSK